ncbi:MAG: nicotinate-nucleotide adenylyltransferase [Pyrinomonadaceae bacterium]|nr:nicotinate-nucleotide adenylyltransferase [Pyrinomonadaceae bacterium]
MVNENAPTLEIEDRRVAFYGGSFDPVHNGHVAIAHALITQFNLDEFVFIPAFHAPHKKRKKPTSSYDRYAMLCIVTVNDPNISVSKIEIELPERPYSVETLPRLNSLYPSDEIFFVMGADSWMDITSWREWETVLSLTNQIVVTRPGHPISTDHVTDEIRSRIVDLRSEGPPLRSVFSHIEQRTTNNQHRTIYLTDSVNLDISATEIRQKIRDLDGSWRSDVPVEVANYIEKYQIYN